MSTSEPNAGGSPPLFESIMSLTWFKSSSIILFLNKTDLFKEKIAEKPVSDYFPDYTGAANDFDASSRYFANKFCSLNRTEDREIYVHLQRDRHESPEAYNAERARHHYPKQLTTLIL